MCTGASIGGRSGAHPRSVGGCVGAAGGVAAGAVERLRRPKREGTPKTDSVDGQRFLSPLIPLPAQPNSFISPQHLGLPLCIGTLRRQGLCHSSAVQSSAMLQCQACLRRADSPQEDPSLGPRCYGGKKGNFTERTVDLAICGFHVFGFHISHISGPWGHLLRISSSRGTFPCFWRTPPPLLFSHMLVHRRRF